MIFIIYFIFLVVFIFLYNIAPVTLDQGFIGSVLLLNAIVLLCFVITNLSKLKDNIFRHSIFILIGFLIVHFQHLLDFFLDGYVVSPIDIWVDKSIVCKSMLISSFGLLFFLIGYQLFFSVKILKSDFATSISTKKAVLTSYPIVLVIFSYLCFIGFMLTADPLYLSGHYGHVDPGPMANRFQLLLGVFLSSAIIIVNRNLYSSNNGSIIFYFKQMGVWLNLIILSYILLVLFIGDRGPALSLILLYFAGYVFRVKNKPRPIIVLVFLFAGIFLMAFTRSYRATDKALPFQDRIALALTADTETKYMSSSQTGELAGSIRTLHYAVTYIPNFHDYKYGWFQLRQVLIAVPGMSNLLDYMDPTFSNKGSTKFITYLDQGQFFTYGLGTTIIADFYIDLGLLGVILGMAIFGFFIGRFEFLAYSLKDPSLLSYIFIMVFMSKSIYIARSTALFPFQEVVWIALIILMNKYAFGNIGKQRLVT